MKKYKTVFFDLDHTLWDFDKNSYETIEELFHNHQLDNFGIVNADAFITVYRQVNAKMWQMYEKNQITKEFLRSGRFRMALQEFNVVDERLSEILSNEYLLICPEKKNLFPGAIEILEYLTQKYKLHIITNGFVEVQHIKIQKSLIGKYFDHIHISEQIGFRKPEKEIFNYAVQLSGTAHEHCIMIGDNLETDIMGAVNAGIDHILFGNSSSELPSFVRNKVNSLEEIRNFL